MNGACAIEQKELLFNAPSGLSASTLFHELPEYRLIICEHRPRSFVILAKTRSLSHEASFQLLAKEDLRAIQPEHPHTDLGIVLVEEGDEPKQLFG